MNVRKRKIYEALLIGLRDEIIRSRVQSVKARQKWRAILNGPVAEGRMERRFQGGLELLEEKDREQIRAIDKALYRLQSDSYNLCECCSGTISAKRLDEAVLPWPTRCGKCEAAGNKQNASRPHISLPGEGYTLPAGMMCSAAVLSQQEKEIYYETAIR